MKRWVGLLALVLLVGSSSVTAMSLYSTVESIVPYVAVGNPNGGMRRAPKGFDDPDYTCTVVGVTQSGTNYNYDLSSCTLTLASIQAPTGILTGTIQDATGNMKSIIFSISPEIAESLGRLNVSGLLPSGTKKVRISGHTVEQPGQPPVFTGQLDVTYEQSPAGPH